MIIFKGDQKPLYGFITKQSDSQITIKVYDEESKATFRTVERDEIYRIVETVSQDKLSLLKPTNPKDYRDYAELLAAKKQDPEAREMAIRLSIITAYLDTSQLRQSALRILVSLARNDQERRVFSALAFKYGASQSVGQASSIGDLSQIDRSQRQALAECIALSRYRKGKRAINRVRDENLGEIFQLMNSDVSLAKFEGLCEKNKLSASELASLLFLELKLRRSLPNELDQTTSSSGWGKLVEEGKNKPIRPVEIVTATEFDPRESTFVEGEWIEE